MTRPILNYELLDNIVELDRHHHLEVNALEPACLRDVSRGVSIGETLPFVAVTNFVLTETNPLVRQLPNCANKTVLMSIDAKGNIKCDVDGVDVDAKSVSKWIADHFHFEFHARGSERSPFRQSPNYTVVVDDHTTWLPWIQEINTSMLRGASLEVEFTVTAKAPPPPTKKSRQLLAKTGFVVRFDNARVLFQLKVDGDYKNAEQLEKQGYWLTLHSDTKPDLRLAVEVIEVETRAEAAASTKKPTGKLAAGEAEQKPGTPS